MRFVREQKTDAQDSQNDDEGNVYKAKSCASALQRKLKVSSLSRNGIIFMVKLIASELTATRKPHQNYVAFVLGEQIIFHLHFSFVDVTCVTIHLHGIN